MAGISPATRFLVDGTEVGGGPATFSMGRAAGAVFTADPEKVARLLPSPLLHPVRWFNRRALVVMAAGDHEAMSIGGLPPIRSSEVTASAMVTYGSSRALPVLPTVGAVLPLVGGALDRRYRMGGYNLGGFTTNRVAAEVLRLVYGLPTQVAPIREDRSPQRLRFTVTDPDGAPILDLDVRAGGREAPVDPFAYDYFAAGSHLLRLTNRQTGSQAVRLGATAARLHLGQHPLAERLRSLDLSPRPLMAIVLRSVAQTVDRPPERLAPTEQPPLPPTPADPITASMVISYEDSREETVDQLPDRLPFDAAGRFEPRRAA